jgi:hypothetical protein
MDWIKERPTVIGWYWIKVGDDDPEPARVFNGATLTGTRLGYVAYCLHCEPHSAEDVLELNDPYFDSARWYGPIDPPDL